MRFKRAGTLGLSVIGLSLGLASVGASQGSPATPPVSRLAIESPSGPRQAQPLPTPVVMAGVATPPAIDWSQYNSVEMCNAAFVRALSAALLPQLRDTLRDTTHRRVDPWLPFPPAAVEEGRRCLNRFRVADLPVPALTATLQTAVGTNADTLVQALVARQLTLAPDAGARAAVLDTAIQLLMTNNFPNTQRDWVLTPAHVRLARAYVSQLDALGAVAFLPRLRVRNDLMIHLNENDVDAQLALQREILQVYQQVPLDSVPAAVKTPEFFFEYKFRWLGVVERIAGLTYVETGSRADLANVVEASKDQEGFVEAVNKSLANHTLMPAVYKMTTEDYNQLHLLGQRAGPLTGDYWFNAPNNTRVPLPMSGKLNVLYFLGSDDQSDKATIRIGVDATLRRVHQALPDVPITVVTQTKGALRHIAFTDHPEQEAALRYSVLHDSLRVPGMVTVYKPRYQTGTTGHMIPLPMPQWEAYHCNDASFKLVVVDAGGMIVFESAGSADEWIRPYGLDLVLFLRHILHRPIPLATDVMSRQP